MNNQEKLQVMNAGKLNAAMNNRIYNIHNVGIVSLAELFAQFPPIDKYIFTQEHETKRKHLEYRKLAEPKKRYVVFYRESHCVEVPKMVYESLNIPERIK